MSDINWICVFVLGIMSIIVVSFRKHEYDSRDWSMLAALFLATGIFAFGVLGFSKLEDLWVSIANLAR